MPESTSRPWSPLEVNERMQRVIERKEQALTDLMELAVLRDQTKHAYERAKFAAMTSGKITGKNADERRARMMAVQPTPGTSIFDLHVARDRAATAFDVATKIIEGYNQSGKLLQTLHVTHREAAP